MLNITKQASRLTMSATKLASLTRTELIGAAFNWSLCLLLMFLMLSQLLTIVLSSSANTFQVYYGRNPLLGPYAIAGSNDEPYSDRLLVCHRRKRHFKVTSVNTALRNFATIVEDTSGTRVNGYRVVNRPGEIVDDGTKLWYNNTCTMINATLEYIFSACNALGYANLTQDELRITDDIYSPRLYRIPNSLPVIIMPYWDNGPSARYAIPGWNGQACMFRLGGKYEDAQEENAYLFAVNRTVRESKTEDWLNRPGGKWKNGWYEDTEGMRWYSDVMSTNSRTSFGIEARHFDMIQKREVTCGSECSTKTSSRWGSDLLMARTPLWMDSVAVSNGTRYGLFLVEAKDFNIVSCTYNTALFISDMSTIMLLVQWMLSMIAVQRGFFKGVSSWHNTDIGCLANSYSFGSLPITMIPRLKMIITAFYTVGCEFEGNQRALAYSWFVIYPSIVQIVLIYSSLLNIFGKIIRRRMSSMQIPVTIMVLSFMHWLRVPIGSSQLFGFDGRISTLVQPDAYEAMSLFDTLRPRTALLLSGDVKSLLKIKVIILLSNTLPLLFSEDMSTNGKQSQAHCPCVCEKNLSIRACNIGGVGHSSLYDLERNQGGESILVLNSYELVRLGYVVVGDTYLMTWESWIRFALTSPFRNIFRWRNHRFTVIQVIKAGTNDSRFTINTNPQLLNLCDPRLTSIKWWDIDSRALQ